MEATKTVKVEILVSEAIMVVKVKVEAVKTVLQMTKNNLEMVGWTKDICRPAWNFKYDKK